MDGKDYAELYSTVTKALNTQIEINEQLRTEIKQLTLGKGSMDWTVTPMEKQLREKLDEIRETEEKQKNTIDRQAAKIEKMEEVIKQLDNE